MTLLAMYRPSIYPPQGTELSFVVERDGVEVATGTTVDDGAMIWKNFNADIERVDTDDIVLTLSDGSTETFKVGNQL